MTPNDFSLIAGVGTVPIVDDWRTLTWNEFLLKAHTPMIFKGRREKASDARVVGGARNQVKSMGSADRCGPTCIPQ
jgi:hypothetical protein